MQFSIGWHPIDWMIMTGIDIVYWLHGFLQPQRLFTPSVISSLMKGCTQATLVENCFSNFVNEHGTIVMSSFEKVVVQCKVHMVHAIFTRKIDIMGSQFMLHSTLHIPRMKYCVVLYSSQGNNASWKSLKETLQTKFTPKSKYHKVVLTKLASLMLKAK